MYFEIGDLIRWRLDSRYRDYTADDMFLVTTPAEYETDPEFECLCLRTGEIEDSWYASRFELVEKARR